MRKLAFTTAALFSVFIGTILPAAAQTAPQKGLRTGYIAGVYTGEVLPGQMDNFKQVAERLIANTAQEPGHLDIRVELPVGSEDL
jgi:hypothetical protein